MDIGDNFILNRQNQTCGLGILAKKKWDHQYDTKNAKCLSEEALRKAEERGEEKAREKGEDKFNWMQSSREQQEEIRRPLQ